MFTQRMHLLEEIDALEKRAQRQQAEVRQHKKRLLDLLYDYRVILAVTLVPAFLWGWEAARIKGTYAFMKQIARFATVTAASVLRKQL